jgi:hypothetical protein
MFGILLAVLVLLVGFGGAQEPAGDQGDPPVRLKRKKRSGEPPAAKQPGKEKESKDKEPAGPKDKDKEKKPAAKEKDEPLDPEDGPMDEEEDDKEVLERIGRNMRSVEDKLGNRELGEPTSQQMRDIVKDIDALIRRKQRSQGGGGGAQQQPQGGAEQQPQGGEQGKQNKQQQGGRSQARKQDSSQRGVTKAGSRQRQQQGQQQGGRRMVRQRPGKQRGQQRQGMAQNNPQPEQGNTGNNPGAGSKSPESKKNLTSDLYKDVWGHLPESLRAEMNAYSNPAPFLPRYDDLIKKYYRNIAEQGRKKD